MRLWLLLLERIRLRPFWDGVRQASFSRMKFKVIKLWSQSFPWGFRRWWPIRVSTWYFEQSLFVKISCFGARRLSWCLVGIPRRAEWSENAASSFLLNGFCWEMLKEGKKIARKWLAWVFRLKCSRVFSGTSISGSTFAKISSCMEPFMVLPGTEEHCKATRSSLAPWLWQDRNGVVGRGEGAGTRQHC